MPPIASKTLSPIKIASLKHRAGFLAVAAAGRKWVANGFILQIAPLATLALKNQPAEPTLHYGLTASKRVGNAVIRNRSRRRLRAMVQQILAREADPAFAYVLIARDATATLDFQMLQADLRKALARLKVARDG